MAIRSPGMIDLTDERIKQILCLGCHHLIWVEKGSDCALYGRCTTCCNKVDILIQATRNDS